MQYLSLERDGADAPTRKDIDTSPACVTSGVVSFSQFYKQFIVSAEPFVNSELQLKLKNTRIVVAGCGSVGNPVAMGLIRSGAENITVLDPDNVEESNLPRQEYNFWDVGKNKATKTALAMRNINPEASKNIRRFSEGLTMHNIDKVFEDAQIIVDAIDIRALDMVWELHKKAYEKKIPVIVGYDLAGTADAIVYRYDIDNVIPLGGELNEEKLLDFKEKKASYLKRELEESEFLNYVYYLFTGPINPLNVPVEQFEEILSRKEGETRTYQIGTTSRVLGSIVVETIKTILSGDRTKSDIHVDLPSLVRRDNPTIAKKLSLMVRAYLKLKHREKKVREKLGITK